MASPIGSQELRDYLRQELQEDPNATLGSTLVRLQELCDEAPADSVTRQQRWVMELTELLEHHHRHRSLEDFLAG